MSAVNPSAINPSSAGTSSEKRAYEPSMEEILASIRRIIADDQGAAVRGSPDAVATVEASQELLRAPAAVDSLQRTSAGHGSQTRQAPRQAAFAEMAAQPDVPPVASAGDRPVQALPHALRAHGSVAAPQYPTPDVLKAAGEADPLMRARPQDTARDAVPPEPLADDDHDAPAALPPPYAPADPLAADRQEDARLEAEFFDDPIEPQVPVDPAPLFSSATDTAVSSAFNMLAASRLADNSEELMTIAKEMIRPMLRAWLDDNLPSMVERMVRAEIERVARGGR